MMKRDVGDMLTTLIRTQADREARETTAGAFEELATLGAAPESCIVVEDSVAGTRAGRAAGMTTVAFQGQGGGLPAAEWTLNAHQETRRKGVRPCRSQRFASS